MHTFQPPPPPGGAAHSRWTSAETASAVHQHGGRREALDENRPMSSSDRSSPPSHFLSQISKPEEESRHRSRESGWTASIRRVGCQRGVGATVRSGPVRRCPGEEAFRETRHPRSHQQERASLLVLVPRQTFRQQRHPAARFRVSRRCPREFPQRRPARGTVQDARLSTVAAGIRQRRQHTHAHSALLDCASTEAYGPPCWTRLHTRRKLIRVGALSHRVPRRR
jgi:hypothetical protein